jgi:serine phosphatase RsbU (regulator of sigma subunit)
MSRLKITSPWIPVSIVMTGALLFFISFRLLSEPLLMLALLVLISLPLFYFPRLLYVIRRDQHPRRKQIINYLGVFSISLMVLSSIFKMDYWVGAGPITIVAAFVFVLNFMTGWIRLKWGQLDGWGRILLILFSVHISAFVLFWLFKSLHWPGGAIAAFLTYYSFYFVFVPFLVFMAIFRRGSIGFKLSDQLLFGFIFAYLLSMTQTRKLSMNAFSESSGNYDQVKKNLGIVESKNNFLYESLNTTKETDSVFLKEFGKARELRKLSDSMDHYIRVMKSRLIARIDKIPVSEADTISFGQVLHKGEVDITSNMLFGPEPENPIKEKYAVADLKQKLEVYSSRVDSLVPEESLVQFRNNKPIDTRDVEVIDDGRGPASWEMHRFHKQSLSTALTVLTSIQADLRYTEQLALNEIFNKANSGRHDNIAAQLAEIATKYETEKKEKQIGLLQKDKEMNDLRMEAKNEEIARNERNFSLVVMALLVFIALTVFVIRANMQRRHANIKLEEQNRVIALQKAEVEKQKQLVEEQHKEITDSINYAQRIQRSLLASDKLLTENLGEHFVLFKPKDVVSGDFYWATAIGKDQFALVTADSTGHGVPGAIMSMLNISCLNEAVEAKDLKEPAAILNRTRESVIRLLSNDGTGGGKDGMDCSLVIFDLKKKKLKYAAANNPVWIVRGQQLIELEPDNMPVGKHDKDIISFAERHFDLMAGDLVITLTDGYADQFGGPKGKKFMYKRLTELMLSISSKPMSVQRTLLEENLHAWMNGQEQVDDITVIGVKVKA